MIKLLAGVAVAAVLSTAAQAATVLTDNFDAEHGGTSALNYTGFANWGVTGQVDLVATPDYGITCVTGSCVDLDGTSGPGRITTANAYSFNAGDTVTFSWMDSGNQRGGGADNLQAGLAFSGLTNLSAFNFGGSSVGAGSYANYDGAFTGLGSSSPWTMRSISFTAAQAGSVKFYLGTDSADNVGPVVDNVGLSIAGGVPEPATWAMMIMGFGFAGAALRRRRAAFA